MSSLLELKDKTARTLKEIYQSVRLTDDGEGFEIPFDDYYIRVTFGEYTEPDQVSWRAERGLPMTYVDITAYVMDTLKPTPALFEFMAMELPHSTLSQAWVGKDKNTEGHLFFALSERIPGDSADPNEIKYAVLNVMWDSNRSGKILEEKFAAKWLWAQD